MGERIITFDIWTKRPKVRTSPKYFSDCQINRTVPWNLEKKQRGNYTRLVAEDGAHKGASKQDTRKMCQLLIEGKRVSSPIPFG